MPPGVPRKPQEALRRAHGGSQEDPQEACLQRGVGGSSLVPLFTLALPIASPCTCLPQPTLACFCRAPFCACHTLLCACACLHLPCLPLLAMHPCVALLGSARLFLLACHGLSLPSARPPLCPPACQTARLPACPWVLVQTWGGRGAVNTL